MKRLISVILTITLFLSVCPLPIYSAGIFTDTAGTWAETAIDRWSAYGIIEGHAGKFKPEDDLTRAEMATILCRLLALTETSEHRFSDVKETDWYAPYINRCFAAGILLGDDGKAMPDDTVTREQAMVFLGRALGIQPMDHASLDSYRDSGEISEWALGYAAAMVDAGIIKGTSDDTISPKDNIDRAATVTILDRAIGDYVNVDGTEIASVNRGLVLVVADNVKVTGVDEGRTVIVGAGADGVTVNGKVMKAGSVTVIGEGTSAYPDLTVERDGETVSGGEYQDIVIASSVGNGDVTIDHVTIHGALIVQGGGSNSIHLNASEVESIQIDKETSGEGAQEPRIELNQSSVQTIEAVKPAIIEAADEDSVIGTIEAKSDISIQGENTVVQNIVAAADNVKLTVKDASVEKITAENPVIVESTGEKSTIKVVEAKSDVTVQGENTQIQAIEVPKDASQKPVINVQDGVVLAVNAENPVEIKGDGKVENVTAAADVTVDSKTVATITVTEAVTVNITGTDEVEVAVETEKSVNISSQNENISVTTTKEEVSVTVNNESVEHIHKWREDAAQYVAPTCSKEGKRVYICDGTGECGSADRTKTEILEKTSHTESVIPAKAATCTSTGLTEGKKCSVCQTVLVEQQVIPMLEHDYAEAWSSDETGHWHECKVCGAKTNFASHIPGAAATEETAQTCTECGRVLVAEIGHICKDHLTAHGATAASCEVPGNSAYWSCTCGKYYSDANAEHLIEENSWVIAPTGHAYGTVSYEWQEIGNGYSCTATRVCAKDETHVESETAAAVYAVTDAANCVKTGTGVYTASFTNSAFTEQTKSVTIQKTAHTEQTVTGYAATCMENGLSDGKKCAVCQTVLVEQQTIPMLGHDFAEVWSSDETYHWHACTREGCTEVTGKTTHTPGAAATEETAQICTECEYVLVPATGHLCGNHLTAHGATAASCEVPGNSAYWSCTCGKYYSDANAEHLIEENSWVIAPTGHTYGTASYEWQEVGEGYSCTATCVCENDPSHVKSETVEAAYAVTDPATCIKTGTGVYTASFTNSAFAERTKTVKILYTDHIEEVIPGRAPTCTENGLTEGIKCSVCQAVLDAQEIIPELGHILAEVWSSDETGHWHACTREGCTEVPDKIAHVPGEAATEDTAQICTVCEYVLAPATGHLCKNHLVEYGETAATCETAGNSAYWSCDCGKYYSDANAEHLIEENSWVIAPTGHTYGTVSYEWQEIGNGYSCTATCICAKDESHIKSETVEAAYTVTKPATCAEAGEGTYTADFYNSDFEQQTKTVEIFSDAHEYGGWISQVNPNGETDGVLGHYHCSVCGKDFDENHNELTSLVIPAGPENFGGAKLSILTDTSGKQLLAMEETGDTVNDAIFKRAIDIEEMHNVHIMESTGNDAAQILQTAIMAGDLSYDTAMIPDTKVSSLFLRGCLKSFHELEIDFDKPWWDSSRNANEQFNFRINNNEFLAAITGPYDLSYYDSHSLVVFNKGLRSSLGINDDFYQKVRNHQWTLEQMNVYAELAKFDINGDEAMTPDTDRFGIVGTFDNFYDSFLAGTGIRYINRDQNTGKLSWSIADNSAAVSVVEQLLNLDDGMKSYTSGRSEEDASAEDVFVDGRSLFFTTTLGDIPALREAIKGEFEIGYLPIPKYTEYQDQYRTLAQGGLMTVVPTYIKENARVHRLSVLLDTFASYSKEYVYPAYLEKFNQKSGDPTDIEMLNLCLDGSTYDLGLSLFKDSDPVTSIKNGIFAGRSNNFASVTASYNKTIESQLSKFEAQLAHLGS